MTSSEISDEVLFTTIQDAYLRGLDWGRKYGSTEAEELKASYDYADKTTSQLRTQPVQEMHELEVTDAMVERYCESRFGPFWHTEWSSNQRSVERVKSKVALAAALKGDQDGE